MKKMNNYLKFDFASFVKEGEKEFTIQSAKYNENKGCVSLNVAITKDDTGENLFQIFYVHLIEETNEAAVSKYPVGSRIVFESASANVWGDYNSQLSVKATVKVVK